MQKWIVCAGLSGLLLTGLTADAKADFGRRWDNWDNDRRWDQRQRLDRRHYQRQLRRWRRQQDIHWRRNGWYGLTPRQRIFWNSRHWPNRGWRLDPIGGAVIGSAASYSFFNGRNQCDDFVDYRSRDGRCFRIERLPDGRERRVELPRSACW